MQHVYYIEVNAICIILLWLMFSRIRQNRSIITSPQIVQQQLILATWLLCLSDIVAGVCRGMFFPGARFLIEGSNLIYLEMMPVISLLWFFYCCRRLEVNLRKQQRILIMIPLMVFTVIALFNPLTHFLFSINEQNLYARGPGVFLHWIVSWCYFFIAGILSLRRYQKSGSWIQRSEILPLMHFLIFPAIGCVTQMAFYGVTSVQVGVTLSIVMISMQTQANQISVDELTGINNRKAMRYYVENLLHRAGGVALTVVMIDINKFKQINDTLGHSTGDAALRDLAAVLKGVCEKSRERLFLSRYGGDEFVIIGPTLSRESMEVLVEQIRQDVAEFSRTAKKPYTLSVSIGCANSICTDSEDFNHCLKMADEAMYVDKKHKGTHRVQIY